jgi:hypothetical protein
VNKSRQIGFSTVVAAEIAWEVTHVPGAVIIIVSKNDSAAVNVLKYVKNVLFSVKDKDPDFPKVGKSNNKEVTFPELGSSVVSLPAAPETGRSYSASHWVFDEIAHTAYAADIFQAAAPTVAQTQGRITVLSTPKGRNFFHELASKPDDYGFEVFTFPWYFCPTYNKHYDQWKIDQDEKWLKKAEKGEWYRSTRKKYSELAFAQEFCCSFDADAETVFNIRQLAKSFKKRNWLTEAYEGEVPEMEYYTSDPTPGHYYASGIDLGRKRDATVILTYDITARPAKLAEYKRIPPGLSWEQVLLTIRQTYGKFKPDMLCDATGVGDVIYENIADIADAFIITDNQYSKNKYNLIENLRRAMDNKAILLPGIPQLKKEHEKYTWNDKKIVQDTVIANALAVSLFFEPETTFVGADTEFSFI